MFPNASETVCCVVGGGPSGMMLGYLLARAGVRVTVLEKHADFFRDFRGDTVHPSTLEVLHELDLLNDFLALPHQEVTSAGGVVGDFEFRGPDFTRVPTRSKFVALMPQWDFLNFLSSRARRFPEFELRMENEVVDLLFDGGRVAGVKVRRPGQPPLEIRADLVVGCDGRRSTVRAAAELEVIDSGAPMDVLWFRISRRPGDPPQVLGRVNYGKMLILVDRHDYFQAGLIVPKGSYPEIQNRGLEAFRESIHLLAPFLEDRTHEVERWDQVQILSVQINRLRCWHRPGLLCIGDAAHAMSPVGGVGINLAIQDAVATANRLAAPLRQWSLRDEDLAAIQQRREMPARVTQFFQIQLHKGIEHAFANPGPIRAPWQMKAILRIPGIHHMLGYAVGIGVRPEHVRDAAPSAAPRPTGWAQTIGAAIGTACGLAVRRWRQPLTGPVPLVTPIRN